MSARVEARLSGTRTNGHPTGKGRHPLRVRADVPRATRVAVKVGSSSLTRPDGHLDVGDLRALTDALAEVWDRGTQVVLVSSGAQAAAMGPLKLKHKPRTLADAQAAASVGQGLLIAEYTKAFAAHGLQVGQMLLTPEDILRRGHHRNASRALERVLSLGVLPIINENDTVVTNEIRFGDNDRLAALVAHLVDADVLVLLTDVDALYDKSPRLPDAKKVEEIHSFDQAAALDVGTPGSSLGTGGMSSKIAAAAMATSSGIPVLLTSAENASRALAGEDVGTWFHVTGRPLAPRQMWLAYAADVRGAVIVDDGAAEAVTNWNASLLPVGVTGVENQFHAGDPIEIKDGEGTVLARGVAGHDSDWIPRLSGMSMQTIEEVYGGEHAHEVVHRDELVVMARHRRVR